MSPVRRTAVVLLAVFGLLAVPATAHAQPGGPGGTFTDDNGSTHEGYIEAVLAAGVTSGCDMARRAYCPSDSVTRAQMASFLARALGLPAATRDHFSDDTGTTHEANINAVAEAGVTTGCGGDRYCPGTEVSRAQMASFLVRALELPPASGDYFADDAGTTHEASINAVREADITTGCGEDAYCPAAQVSRAQMATFLGRGLGLEPRTPPPVVTFGPGSQRVGVDIAAGTYRNSDSSELCYWERQSGFGGTLEEVLANDLTPGRTLVTIAPSDAGFASEGCGTWTNDLWPITASLTAPFGDGTFLVGTEVASGTWRSAGPGTDDDCYWERLGGFSGLLDDILANDFVDAGPATVTIAAGDAGFASFGCGTWTRIG